MVETSYPVAQGAGVTEALYEKLMSSPINIGRVPVYGGEYTAVSQLAYGDSSGRQVKVAAGQAYTIRGYRWESGDDVLVVALNANTSGKTRIDRLVLRLDRSTWAIRLAVVQGTPADTPVPPTPNQTSAATGVFEVPIAQITVRSNAGSGLPSIAAADVKSEHLWTQPRGVWSHSAFRAGATGIGKFYFEYDTGRLYMGTDAGDILIGENGPYTKIAVAGGWVNDAIYAQRVNGTTYLTIHTTLSSTTNDKPPSTDLTVCTIPAQFRPQYDVVYNCTLTPYQVGLGIIDAATGVVKLTAYGEVFPKGGILNSGMLSWPSTGVRS